MGCHGRMDLGMPQSKTPPSGRTASALPRRQVAGEPPARASVGRESSTPGQAVGLSSFVKTGLSGICGQPGKLPGKALVLCLIFAGYTIGTWVAAAALGGSSCRHRRQKIS